MYAVKDITMLSNYLQTATDGGLIATKSHSVYLSCIFVRQDLTHYFKTFEPAGFVDLTLLINSSFK